MKLFKIAKSSEETILLTVSVCTIVDLTLVLFIVWCTPNLYNPTVNGTNYICLNGLKDGLYCGFASEIFWIYLKKAINTQFEKLEDEETKSRQTELNDASNAKIQHALQESYWDMKPFARLTGVPGQKQKPYELAGDHQKIRNWEDVRGRLSYEAFLQNGAKYRNGNYVVTISGIYHIYSNIHLQAPYVSGIGCPNINEFNILQHSISKFNILEGKQIELTTKSHLPKYPYRDGLRCSFYNSYLEVIQLLNAGDEISVSVSNVTFLPYPEMNYFGITMV